MKLAILLLCGVFSFGQNTASTPQAEEKPPAKDSGENRGLTGKTFGGLDVLTDTEGIDFGPYLTAASESIKRNWHQLIPANAFFKKGTLSIEFAIKKDGDVAGMKLVATSGDVTLDRAAWGSIAASNPFKPLPVAFTKPYIALRIRFYYNPENSNSNVVGKTSTDSFKGAASETPAKPKSRVNVVISGPADLRIPLRGLQTITALVTGTGSQDNTVEWRVSGFGCSGSGCGEMLKDTYHAPAVLPNPPFVTVTAISKADPSAKVSVTVHIFDDRSQ